MSFPAETDAPIPIPPRPEETDVASSSRTDSGTLAIADTPSQNPIINEQNNDDLNNQAMQETHNDLELPQRPPKDLEFNDFLLCIAEHIEHDDLEKMKFLLSGEEGLSTRTRQRIKSPIDLFEQLKNMSFISRHDILYLQLMLRLTGKKKAIKMACDFASNAGETLHFFPPPEKPADGYKYVKLHVKVPDAHKYKRQSLEQLRRRVSMLSFAPESSIHIVGVELQSILVTFMVPSVYAEILEDMLERNVNVDVFQEMMVDRVVVCSKRFTIDFKGDRSADTNNNTSEAGKNSTAVDKSQVRKRQNEESKTEYLKLANELETIKMTMEQKEEDSSREIDKLKKENTSLILELENMKRQNHLEHPRFKGVKHDGEWSKGGAHYKLTSVSS